MNSTLFSMNSKKRNILEENNTPKMIDLDEKALSIAILEYLKLPKNTIYTLQEETGLTERYLRDVRDMKANPTLDAMKRITKATNTKMKLHYDWPKKDISNK